MPQNALGGYRTGQSLLLTVAAESTVPPAAQGFVFSRFNQCGTWRDEK